MPAFMVSSLIIAVGILSVGVGIALALDILYEARRVHTRMISRATGILEGWDAWFLGGFSHIALGCRGLQAAAMCVGWSVIGLGCIGLGVHALGH